MSDKLLGVEQLPFLRASRALAPYLRQFADLCPRSLCIWRPDVPVWGMRCHPLARGRCYTCGKIVSDAERQ